MSIAVREALKQARSNLMLVSIDTSSILARLETIERVLPLSPDEAVGSCFALVYHMRDCADGMDDGGDNLRCIGNDLFAIIKGWYDSNKLAFRADRRNWDRGDVESVCVGRWESRGGKHYVELWWGRYDYHYHSNNASGSVCNPKLPLDQALTVMQAKLDRGMFLPDVAVVPMKRVS